VPSTPSTTSSRTALPSQGRHCRRFSRGRQPLATWCSSEFAWVGQCLRYISLQTCRKELDAASRQKGCRSITPFVGHLLWSGLSCVISRNLLNSPAESMLFCALSILSWRQGSGKRVNLSKVT
jgi:hypothetical protein